MGLFSVIMFYLLFKSTLISAQVPGMNVSSDIDLFYKEGKFKIKYDCPPATYIAIAFSILVAIAVCYIFNRRTKKLNFRSIRLIDIKEVTGFRAVWKATYKSQSVLAISLPYEEKDSWLNEIAFYNLPHINHPNITPFIGFTERRRSLQDTYWLITSSNERGPLNLYLKENLISLSALLKITDSIVKGLMFLHDEMKGPSGLVVKPTVAHRDFSSRNIMIKDDFTATISGFTSSLIFHPNELNIRTCAKFGCINYLAPEILIGETTFSKEGFLSIDMYAFGLVLWELLSRCPIENQHPEAYKLPFQSELGENLNMNTMKILVADYKGRPLLRDSWIHHPILSFLCNLIEGCWRSDPLRRLTVNDVFELFLAAVSNDFQEDTEL